MTGRRARAHGWAALRVAAALLILAAVGAQLARTVGNALENLTPHGSHLPTVTTNFFSFFTVQSNVLAAIVLLWAALWTWTRGRSVREEPSGLSIALTCVTTYMILTGVVYNILLRGIELPQGQTVPWSNEVLHVVGPLFLLADLLFAPRRRGLPWPAVAIALIYPLAWVTYTLVRGPLVVAPGTGAPWWYPYPFLDPNGQGGVAGVIVYVVVIAIAVTLIAAGVVWAGRARSRRPRR